MELNASAKSFNSDDIRRTVVSYHASAWGDYFLTHTSDFKELCSHEKEAALQKKIAEVKKLLIATPDDSWNKMHLIDAIQRLGVGYIFEEEINKTLEHIYKNYLKCNAEEDHDLRKVATRFRLLRQQGFNVSSDVFNKFKGYDGKFQASLVNNIDGMVSLYEAAQFRVHGEDILEGALQFSSTHLQSFVQINDNATNINPVAARVDAALKLPIHKTLTIVGVKKFMSTYQDDESHNEVLLKLAKQEFNKVQKMYQKELQEITRWWKALDFENKLPFARDRMVECYFWILGIYFEPQHHLGRKILSKVIAMASVADDIYDVYGTLEELQLLTEAIQRLDESCLNQLPPYLRYYYQALLDVYAEAEEELDKTGKSDFVCYAKEEMKKLMRAYYEEAKWLHSKHIPGMEEYMKVAVVSSGYMMVAATSLLGMGIKEDFEWVSSEPPMVRAACLIARLMDDMAGYGFEQKNSSVECYMNQNSATKEEAFEQLQKQVSLAWKDINQEALHPTMVPMPILMRVVNSARVIHLLYKDGDGYTNSKNETKDLIKSLLSEPLTV